MAFAQEEVCPGPFTRAEWREVLTAVDEALDELDGNRADRLLDYVHHELRCMTEVAHPEDVGRMAMQEAVVHWYDQDPDEAVRWAWTALETVGADAPWPAITPTRMLDRVADTPQPELTGPRGLGLVPPKGGAFLRNGFLLTQPEAPVRVQALVQVVDKQGVVQETRWQDGAAFDDAWLARQADPVEAPRWYEPPPRPRRTSGRSATAGTDEVDLRWDIEPSCPWKGQPRRAELSGRHAQVNRQGFALKSDADDREFLRVLRQRNCIGMVAEADDRVLGFMIYTLHKSHLQVSKFAVVPEARRRGVGRQMMAKLFGKLGERRHRILITAPLSERCDGPLFLKAMGFIATMVFSDTPEPGIDTLEFVLRRDWIDS